MPDRKVHKTTGMALLAGIIVLSLAVIWPQLTSNNRIYTKSAQSPTVAIFNAWTIGWNAVQLREGIRSYWDAPIFAPKKKTFAFSEPQPATMLVAPLVWISGSELVGYKAWLLLSLVGNGVAAVLLCRQLGYQVSTQAATAAAVILLPIAQQRIDVIQLIPIWGILWFFRCVLKLQPGGSFKDAVECGCSFGFCFWLCVHHALFLCLLLPICAVPFLSRAGESRFRWQCVTAAAVGLLVAAPVVVPIAQAMKDNEFERGDQIVQRQAAMPAHYLSCQDNSITTLFQVDSKRSRQLCIGWLRMLAAVAGIAIVLRNRQQRIWGIFLILLGGLSFLFSLGPNLSIAGWHPWDTIRNSVPGFGQVRNTFRFAWFVQLASVFLAAVAFDRLVCSLKSESGGCKPGTSQFSDRLKTALSTLVIGLCACILAAEVVPEPPTSHKYPDTTIHEEWIHALQSVANPGNTIVCLPLPASSKLRDYRLESEWMIYSLKHRIPMLNGYSGFFPQNYLRHLSQYRNEGLTDSFFADLISAGISHVIVKSGSEDSTHLQTAGFRSINLKKLFSDADTVEIYELKFR